MLLKPFNKNKTHTIKTLLTGQLKAISNNDTQKFVFRNQFSRVLFFLRIKPLTFSNDYGRWKTSKRIHLNDFQRALTFLLNHTAYLFLFIVRHRKQLEIAASYFTSLPCLLHNQYTCLILFSAYHLILPQIHKNFYLLIADLQRLGCFVNTHEKSEVFHILCERIKKENKHTKLLLILGKQKCRCFELSLGFLTF